MTYMRAWMSSKFGQIRLLTAELAAIERLKKSPKTNMGKMVLPYFSAILGPILFILAGKDYIHKSLDEFEIRPDLIRDHRDRYSFFSFHSCGYTWKIWPDPTTGFYGIR